MLGFSGELCFCYSVGLILVRRGVSLAFDSNISIEVYLTEALLVSQPTSSTG